MPLRYKATTWRSLRPRIPKEIRRDIAVQYVAPAFVLISCATPEAEAWIVAECGPSREPDYTRDLRDRPHALPEGYVDETAHRSGQ